MKLPADLHAAFDWTNAAGEFDTLRDLSGPLLATYCFSSAANAAEHGVPNVHVEDLVALHGYLVTAKEAGCEWIQYRGSDK